jgi:hypothetical protein
MAFGTHSPRDDFAPFTTIEYMPNTYLWQLWSGRHWPLTVQEEVDLVADLEARTTRHTRTFERGDITAVLNVIRLGLSIDELLAQAPGAKPARLLAGYRALDAKRTAALASFHQLCENPTKAVLARHGARASTLLPVPTFRIAAALQAHLAEPSDVFAASQLTSTVDKVRDLCTHAGAAVILEERLLTTLTATPRTAEIDYRAQLVGRNLYNPYEECLWSAQFYLPRRVGDLVPTRVADLLGESE